MLNFWVAAEQGSRRSRMLTSSLLPAELVDILNKLVEVNVGIVVAKMMKVTEIVNRGQNFVRVVH